MPPEATVGIGWPGVDVDRAPVFEAGDDAGREAGSIAHVGAVARHVDDGVVRDLRAELIRQATDRVEKVPVPVLAVDVSDALPRRRACRRKYHCRGVLPYGFARDRQAGRAGRAGAGVITQVRLRLDAVVVPLVDGR